MAGARYNTRIEQIKQDQEQEPDRFADDMNDCYNGNVAEEVSIVLGTSFGTFHPCTILIRN